VATTKGALADSFPNSMSGSYYTHMRNVFVGSMCAIGVFLIGYRRSRVDNWLSTFAGILALLVALFPTSRAGTGTSDDWQPRVHRPRPSRCSSCSGSSASGGSRRATRAGSS